VAAELRAALHKAAAAAVQQQQLWEERVAAVEAQAQADLHAAKEQHQKASQATLVALQQREAELQISHDAAMRHTVSVMEQKLQSQQQLQLQLQHQIQQQQQHQIQQQQQQQQPHHHQQLQRASQTSLSLTGVNVLGFVADIGSGDFARVVAARDGAGIPTSIILPPSSASSSLSSTAAAAAGAGARSVAGAVYAFDAPPDTRSVNEPLQPAASAARPRAARSMRVQFVPLAPAQHHHQLQEDTACALPRNLLIVSYSLVSAAESIAYPPLVLTSSPPFSLLPSCQGPISSHHVCALSRVGSTSGQFEVSPAAALHLSHVYFSAWPDV
jgi:hypothetical protein